MKWGERCGHYNGGLHYYWPSDDSRKEAYLLQDRGWPWVTETLEGESVHKGELLLSSNWKRDGKFLKRYRIVQFGAESEDGSLLPFMMIEPISSFPDETWSPKGLLIMVSKTVGNSRRYWNKWKWAILPKRLLECWKLVEHDFIQNSMFEFSL